MATDYDSPRGSDDQAQHPLEEVTARGPDAGAAAGDADEADDAVAAGFELPGADISGEELTVQVLPKQQDEFTCTRCFLVHHRSQLASTPANELVCADCAG